MTILIVTSWLPRTLAKLAVWGVAAYGTLALSRLPGDGGAHVICGPWGCLPPFQALASTHLFWLLILVPAAVWAVGSLRRANTLRLGWAAFVGGLGGTLSLMGYSVWGWGLNGPWWHAILHALFDVAMFVDVPLVELTAIGAACIVIASRSTKRPVELDGETQAPSIERGSTLSSISFE